MCHHVIICFAAGACDDLAKGSRIARRFPIGGDPVTRLLEEQSEQLQNFSKCLLHHPEQSWRVTSVVKVSLEREQDGPALPPNLRFTNPLASSPIYAPTKLGHI